MRIGMTLAMTAALAATGAADAAKGTANADRLLAGRTPGKPVQCISQTRVIDTQTFDDGSIYYRMGESNDYLQRPYQCSMLNSNRSYVTSTPSTQLCAGDSLQIYDSMSHIPYGSCIFESFVPYPKAKKH